MFRVPVLILATVLSSTALWSAFVEGSMSVLTALVRFLVAVPVAALMTWAFRQVMSSDNRTAPTAAPEVAQQEVPELSSH
ncbi:MAG: hypothetical protein QOE71_209 [Pseudonocardiales bacterium]|jgi:hypothetical protein|nr:hypothetical protein [Pseudonocardiales bacterium]